MKNNREHIEYDRYFAPHDVWAIAFGCAVGWGTFVMPGTTFLPVAGPLGTLIALVISTVFVLIIGRNFSFLMTRKPGTGGIYSYTREAFGRDHAFICSWFLCLSYLTIVFLNGTSLFVVIRTMFGSLLQTGYRYTIAGNEIFLGEVCASVVALAGVGLLMIKAKPLLQRLHTLLSVVLLLGAVIVGAACLLQLRLSTLDGAFGLRHISPGFGIFSIVLLAPWAFVGFEVISLETAHFDFELKKSRWIVVVSILTAGLVYILMSLVSVSAVPEGYASWQAYILDLDHATGVSSVPVFYAARAIMGLPGQVILGVTAFAAILTGIIGAYRATTRMLSTMAEDKILSDKFSTTTYSILFIMIISIVLSFFGRNTLNWFVDLTSFGAIVGFGYTSAAAWKIARMEGNRRIVVTSIIGTVISAVFTVVQIIPHLTAFEAMGSEAFLLLSLWCLLGFIFYWRTVKTTNLAVYNGISASGIVLFALLTYSAMMWVAKSVAAAETVERARTLLRVEGAILLVIVFVGLWIMLYIQRLVREKHEALERERIHAVESSLAKSQFLFNMSHDIRTPMNAIIGYTNLAIKANESEEVQTYLEKIVTSSQHLLSLINDILEMSRIESGKVELEYAPADLCGILEDLRDLFSEQMRQKNLDFHVQTAQVRNRYVWCDRKNLNRVLLNILSNAYKFTPEGGSITASVWEGGRGEDGRVAYELRVQDTGIGMSREFAEKMFNAFERERTSTVSGIEGTGLGLSITKSIVDLMGGDIEVITSPGSGTEFIIRLKFELAEAADMPRRSEGSAATDANAPVDFSTKRLLLVEDNDINREIAVMILSQAGFTVETAANGKLALDMVAASAPGYYDLILMDIQMPEMDGYEATRAIRALDDKELAGIPIVAMTANAFKEDELAAASAGMQAHIAKPLDIPRMMQTLTELLQGKQNT